jgi:hypothetical protein
MQPTRSQQSVHYFSLTSKEVFLYSSEIEFKHRGSEKNFNAKHGYSWYNDSGYPIISKNFILKGKPKNTLKIIFILKIKYLYHSNH